MTANLRPMNLGEILDRTFHIYRSRFLVFVGIALIPALLMRAIYIVNLRWVHAYSLVHAYRQPGTFLWNFVVGLAFYHIASFFGLLVLPAHIRVASTATFGEECSLTCSLRFFRARWRRYLAVTALKLLGDLVGPEIIAALIFVGAGLLADKAGGFDGGAQWPIVPVILLPAVVGCGLFFWAGASLSLGMNAAALEDLGAWKAMRRSWTLSRGTRARVWFTWLAITLAATLATSIAQVTVWWLVTLVSAPLHYPNIAREVYWVADYALATAVSMLFGPIYPIALTLFYYDQRIRREGFDIERMMDAAGLTAPPIPPAADAPPAPAATQEGLA